MGWHREQNLLASVDFHRFPARKLRGCYRALARRRKAEARLTASPALRHPADESRPSDEPVSAPDRAGGPCGHLVCSQRAQRRCRPGARLPVDRAGAGELVLEVARDHLGTLVADALPVFAYRHISFAEFGEALEDADRNISGGQLFGIIRKNFEMREIGFVKPGPRLKKPDKHSHSLTDRTITPRHLEGY